ncbi:trypsin-like peptidase domain-containing protein [Staphylococcus agnetis]|uniref:trypsin-like serine peptidase n=1 Tax=Staphylococcus agnetis TaxID=985762 RepID=UPI00208DFB4F|nr:trypsin-like peptidase domain-containing protein [Staphylococcus agnetis]MCO4327852.1 trypsin-like peptidase domain-containing protein [Staphylococcus agnetis]MCO4353693.1 trypsin-like peptidase domain-containing protein [Staphylococcus agnetis]MCO4370249.1 trypsin-like peptidase domain-containing protein [Staphylococcus agnetis]
MNLKFFNCIMSFLVIGNLIISGNGNAQVEESSRTIVDTQKDPKGKVAARYDPSHSLYCSATIITPNIGITSRHCVGSKKQEGYIGALYPGQSNLSTPFGKMNVSTYIPNDASDIAIVKGTENDMDNSYKQYLKDVNVIVSAFTEDELKNLKGKKVYSYGYPGDSLTGYTQYRSSGIITDYNPVTRDLSTSIPTSPGQSGSGVFLEDGDKFLGVLHSKFKDKNGKDVGRVTPINERLKKWFDDNTAKSN